MKILKHSLAALLAAASLTAVTPAAHAEDTTPTPPPHRARGGMSVDAQLAHLTEALTLTDEQKPKVKAVLEDQSKKRQELRGVAQEDRAAKIKALREEMTKKLKEILTPEQFKKFEAMPKGPRGPGGGTPPAGQ